MNSRIRAVLILGIVIVAFIGLIWLSIGNLKAEDKEQTPTPTPHMNGADGDRHDKMNGDHDRRMPAEAHSPRGVDVDRQDHDRVRRDYDREQDRDRVHRDYDRDHADRDYDHERMDRDDRQRERCGG